MPDLDRLMREAAIYCDGPAVPWMTARDIAEAALREQAREIVEALRSPECREFDGTPAEFLIDLDGAFATPDLADAA